MPRFVQFLQQSGVYAEQDFMIVPRPGFNLVCLRDSKGVRLSHDNRLQVDVIGFDDVERVALEYINYRYGKKKARSAKISCCACVRRCLPPHRRTAWRAATRSRPEVEVFRNSRPRAAT